MFPSIYDCAFTRVKLRLECKTVDTVDTYSVSCRASLQCNNVTTCIVTKLEIFETKHSGSERSIVYKRRLFNSLCMQLTRIETNKKYKLKKLHQWVVLLSIHC